MTPNEQHIRMLARDIEEALQGAMNAPDHVEALRRLLEARAAWANLSELIDLRGTENDDLRSIRYAVLGGDPFGAALVRDTDDRAEAIADLRLSMGSLMDVLDDRFERRGLAVGAPTLT